MDDYANYEETASALHEAYAALVEKGFTPAQAFDLLVIMVEKAY